VTPQQLLDAAELIAEVNARDGLDVDTSISPSYLREQARELLDDEAAVERWRAARAAGVEDIPWAILGENLEQS